MKSHSSPINRAFTLMLLLGGVTLAMGIFAAGPLAISLLIGRAKFGAGQVMYFLLCTIAFFLPPVLYFVAAFNLRRRKAWAAIMGIVVATIHGIAAVLVIIAGAIAIATFGLFMLVPIGVASVILCIAIFAVSALPKALQHLNDADETSIGFEPVR